MKVTGYNLKGEGYYLETSQNQVILNGWIKTKYMLFLLYTMEESLVVTQ